MRILLRKLDSEYYVWKNAEYSDGYFQWVDEHGCANRVRLSNILKVDNNNENGYVVCNSCGELIENNPEAIERHFAKKEVSKDCLSCTYLRTVKQTDLGKAITKKEDGTYDVVEHYTAILKCYRECWRGEDINSQRIPQMCKFYDCRRHGVSVANDIINYPDLFNVQATVDMLNANKYSYERYSNGYFEYDLKCNNAVKACVNPLGIIDHFIIKCRTHTWDVYYSATHEKLYFKEHDCLSPELPNKLTQNRYEQAKAKIASLYKRSK